MSGGAPQTDHALLILVAEGNEQALGALYDKYSPALYAVAYRIAGERSDAEEIVLETFAQMWREASRFRIDRGSVAAWLTMICRSRALDLVRSRSRRARLLDQASQADQDAVPAMGSSQVSPERSVDQGEHARRVSDALALLSPPQRQAIELAYYHGLSQSEIAERLQEPLGTVKTRVRLAMLKLREALRPYYPESST